LKAFRQTIAAGKIEFSRAIALLPNGQYPPHYDATHTTLPYRQLSFLSLFRKALQMMRLQADSEVLRGSIARPVYSHDLIFSWS
jgi:hypothetical protein